MLDNGAARFVVRGGTEGHAMVGLSAGHLVDAVLEGHEDPVRSYATTASFYQVQPETFEVVGNSLSVRGPLVGFQTVHDALPLPEPARFQVRYVIDDVDPVLTIETTTVAGEVGFADLPFLGGDTRLWVPGVGLDEEMPISADARILGLAPVVDDDAVAAAATGSTTPRSLLVAGAVTAVLHEPAARVERFFALGDDLASAMELVAERLGDPVETVEQDAPSLPFVGEIRGEDGALTRCRTDACASPASGDVVDVWLGDGNGGPSGPRQEGEPAEVRVVTDGPFRLAAWRTVDDDIERRDLLDADGDGTFLLPAGDWELWVLRGPTHTWHYEQRTLVPGDAVRIDADLRRVVDTTGWVSADLHVHTEFSPDSDVTVGQRLIGAVAEDLDVIVLTDHDHATAYDEVPEGLTVITGAEITTITMGHVNTWPVTSSVHASGNGAPAWHGSDFDGIVGALDGVWMCNHPRFSSGFAAVFDIPGFDPATCPLIELVNAGTFEAFEPALADWMAVLNRGDRVPITGTSDSHTTDHPLGNARTWVRGSVQDLDAGLLAGRSIATGGPFLTVTVGGAEVGDTAKKADVAEVRIQAPDWMALGELVLLADGVEVDTLDVSGTEAAKGLQDVTWSVDLPAASWVVAMHRGAPATRPGLRREPIAVTNPVYINASGD